MDCCQCFKAKKPKPGSNSPQAPIKQKKPQGKPTSCLQKPPKKLQKKESQELKEMERITLNFKDKQPS